MAILVVIAGVLPTFSAHADDIGTFKKVLALTERKQWEEARAVAKQNGTLTEAVYEWLALQREDERYDFNRYRGFLSEYPDWPYSRRIRAHAESVLPAEMRVADIEDFYRDGLPITLMGMRVYARALVMDGREGEAQAVLEKWFPDVPLTDVDQVRAVSALRALLTSRALMGRLDTLITDEKYKQALALGSLMGSSYAKLAEARVALARKQGNVEDAIARVPADLRNDPGLVYDRLKWRRRQDETQGMADLILSLPENFRPYNETAFWREQEILAYRLLTAKQGSEAYRIAARNFYDGRAGAAQSDWLAGYIALSELKQPGRAFMHFEKLYKGAKSPLTRARAAFWAARASETLKYEDIARAWYRTASAYRGNFYGQMATGKIPSGNAYRNGPPVATAADQQEFMHSNLARAARLVCSAREEEMCDQFLSKLADRFEGRAGLMRLVVDLALEMKRMSVAVKISREAAPDGIDFADYVFPVIPWVDDGVSKIDPALAHAVIRQESGFDPGIGSSAGAQGLMQLMPATAKAVARQNKQSHRKEWLTSKPEHNVRLGTSYLAGLIRQYDGSHALALAAYNAGPGRVSEWLRANGDPRAGEVDVVDWIERIPVYETRNYVQRVLEGATVYRRRMTRS